jgi:hypothetical protein
MNGIDAIKAKIRALRAKTVANGCTEDEAMAAASKAMELMRRHGLAESEVACGEEVRPLGRAKRTRVDGLWTTVGWTCHCRTWFQEFADGRLSVVYFGRDPWPEVAGWLHEVMAGAVRRALREFTATPSYRRRRTERTRRAARDAFVDGMVRALILKLIALKGEDPEQRADLALADRAVQERGIALRTMAARSAPSSRFGNDRVAGVVAGRQTTVAWGMTGTAPAGVIGSGAR